MKQISLGEIEERFAHIVWDAKVIKMPELLAICAKEFDWKRTTTYTVLKRLCNKGLFDLNHGTVTVVMTEEEFLVNQSQAFIEKTFGNSLPAFFCAFTNGRKLREDEVDYLSDLVKSYKE